MKTNKVIAKNIATGLYFKKGHHFTVTRKDATPLDPVELAYVRFCYEGNFMTEPAPAPRKPKADPVITVEIPVEAVGKVYSGKSGSCRCGCNGTYRYSPDFQTQGGKERGYEVKDEEVNMRQVKRVVKILNTHLTDVEFAGDFADLQLEGRDYTVYFKDPDLALERARLENFLANR